MAVLKEKIVASLLNAHEGNMSQVARECGVSRQAVHLYVKDRPKLMQILLDCRESMKDTAENSLNKAIKECQPWAVCFFLKTQARDRGYIEKREVETSGTLRLELVEEIVHVDCITADSTESLEASPSPIGLLPEPS